MNNTLLFLCIQSQYILNLPNITNSLFDESKYTVGISVTLNGTTSYTSSLQLNISSENLYVFRPINRTLLFSEEDILGGYNKSLDIVTSVIGVTKVTFVLFDDTGTIVRSESVTVVVDRKGQTVDLIFTSLLAIFVLIATTFMGCGLDLQIVKKNIVRPAGPIVGFICQFAFMPLISFGLGYLFFDDNLLRLGLFMIGCSPGGTSSNFWTILFNGDVNLSITMTFISSLAAIGMMPLWVYMVTPLMNLDDGVKIPYLNLVISVVTLTIPLGIGLLVRKYKRTWADFAAEKLVKPISFLIIIFVITMGMLNGAYLFRIWTWQVALGGLFLAWAGFAFGAFFAWLMRLDRPKIIAISLETALQNGSIAYLVLKASLPGPYSDIAAMPAITALFMTGFTLYFGYGFYFAWGKIRKYRDRRMAKRRIRLDKPDEGLSSPLNNGLFITAAAGLPPGMPLPGDISPSNIHNF